MSDHLVRVVMIDELRPHPNADRLEIAVVGGWQVVVQKDNWSVGDVAVHVPPDSMVLEEYADEWGVKPYLAFKKNARAGRVKAVRLRSEPSFGFLVPNNTGAEVGTDLREVLEIEKYEAPAKTLGAGQMAKEHPCFHHYTNIQNLRNYPDAVNYDEPLIVTEKLHGTNSRIGWVRKIGSAEKEFEMVVGSHRTQREMEEPGVYGVPLKLHGDAFEQMRKSLDINQVEHSLIIFGEIFGPGVQDLRYEMDEPSYRVFDIAVDGKYVPHDELVKICSAFGLPRVPVLDCDIFTFDELCDLAEGNSTLTKGQIKEGIVVRPLEEETWGGGRRTIMKVISPDYLCRKGGTEDH